MMKVAVSSYRSKASNWNAFHAQQHLPVNFLNVVELNAFDGFVAFAGLEIELMGMKRTDDFIAANYTFR